MKKLILIALALSLALAIVWLPSVGAAGPYPITIIKTIPAGGPEETFTFYAWRDYNNNGVVDTGDAYLGYVEITGAGTGVIYSPVMGQCIVREELSAGSAYEQQPDKLAQPGCVPVEFNNEVQVQEVGQIVILKQDGAGNPLEGATFEISPNPKTGALPALTVVDEGLNDEAIGQPGVLQVTECQVCVTCTVTETVPPPGYTAAPAQTAHVTTAGETVELTFVNEKGELIIEKVDGSGNALAGACFDITPDPKTGAGVMTLCDNGLNDECPADGVLCVSDCIIGTVCIVEETVAPTGYDPADPQTVTISASVTLTFVNTERTPSCGTVCAAQTAPGEFLFTTEQENWFTYITYNKGDGTGPLSAKTYPIYTGKTTLCGTLYVYDNGTHIFVNYVLTDMDGCTLAGLSEYHLQVDRTFNDLKKHVMNKKNVVPGKCEYKGTFDPMVPATGWIECTKDNISGWTTAYILAHGVGCYYCS
jgi:hypothetical protein